MKTPTPDKLMEEHSIFLKGVDSAIQEANLHDTCLDVDELLADNLPACDDAYDVIALATEANIRIIANYLHADASGAGYLDEISESSLIHDSAEVAAKIALELTIAATAKALSVDGYLLWSTLMNGKKVHAPTIHLYDGGDDEWLDGRTKERVNPP